MNQNQYHIVEIKGWKNVGYLEDSKKIPANRELPEKKLNNPTWKIENAHLPANRLFSAIKVPLQSPDIKGDRINYWEMKPTKYLRVVYSGYENEPIYGWVDGVSLVNKVVAVINWHPDKVRNNIGKYSIEGTVVRRAPKPTDTYYPIPYRLSNVGIEHIPLNDQARGIYWVILSYTPGRSFLAKTINSALELVPGGNAVKGITGILGGLSEGFKSFFQNLSASVMPHNAENNKINTDGRTGDKYVYYKCLTFPVSAKASDTVYFRSVIDPDEKGHISPTLASVCNGSLAAHMGIAPAALISCYISPTCPLGWAGGIGRQSNPILLTRGTPNIELSYDATQNDVLNVETYNDDTVILETRYGLHKVGKISEGCGGLREFLTNYYLGNQKIKPFETKDGKYKVIIKKSQLWGLFQDRFGRPDRKISKYRLTPLKNWLNHARPGWEKQITYLNRIGFAYEYKIGNITYYYSKLFDLRTAKGAKLAIPPEWKMKTVIKNDVTHYIWSLECPPESIFIDATTSDENMERYKNEETDEARSQIPGQLMCYLSFMSYHHTVIEIDADGTPMKMQRNLDDLYVALDPNSPKLDLIARNVDGCGLYHLTSTWSIDKDWVGMYYVSSEVGSWPCKHYTLENELYSDENRDLVLIGPSGNIVYRFPRGFKVKSYSMQTIIGNNSGYIKVSFNTNYPFANGHEVDIPLTPCNITAGYVDRTLQSTEIARMYFKRQIEDDSLSAQRALEDENRKAERNLQLATVAATTTQGLKAFANNAFGYLVDSVNSMGDYFQDLNADIAAAKRFAKETGGGGLPGIVHNDTHRDEVRARIGNRASEQREKSKNILQRTAEIFQDKDIYPTYKKQYDAQDAAIQRGREAEDTNRQKLRRLAALNIPPENPTMSLSADMSWVSRYGAIEFVYIYKDVYSMREYWKTVDTVGISVNETKTSDEIKEMIKTNGPIIIENAEVSGDELERSDVSNLQDRFRSGGVIRPDL